MKFGNIILLCLLGFTGTNCSENATNITKQHITICNQQFVDSQQRTIIWNGLNHVNKNPKQGYVNDNDEKLFRQFQLWGVNCVRYGIHWDGLEPEPGKIDEKYLREIDKRVYWARLNNISLILDMHQDLYGRKFDNGAPLWATLDEGLPHVTGQVWSDAYLMSPAIQKAFDNFWENKPAIDGIGVQDHYVNVWKKIAERYADSTSVVGFDVMNEPFMGTSSLIVVEKLMQGCASYLAEVQQINVSKEDMLTIWSDEKKRNEVLTFLDDKKTFKGILEHSAAEVHYFEENQLSTFYQKVRDAVRSSGSQQILFLEHNYFCNMGIESTFRTPLDSDGQPDKLCAYAPHAYDLVVDTEGANKPGYKRLDTIFEQIQTSAQNRNLPIFIGEWGAFYMGGKYLQPAQHHIHWIARLKAGHTYWSWWKGIETQDYFSTVIFRPYPQYINGKLTHYAYDNNSNSFVCQWKEGNVNAPSRFYLPNINLIKNETFEILPKSDYKVTRISNTSEAGYLEIKYCGRARELRISLRH